MSNSLYDDFNQLRAAIVRAASRSWQDEHFKNAFVETPLQAMENGCGYQCPFNVGMKVKLSNPTTNPHWFDPVHTGGWIGTNNTVRLYIPPAPTDPKQKAEALATFTQAHSIFFSRKSPK